MSGRVPANAKVEQATSAADYVGVMQRVGGPFDVIVIDGAWRNECADEATSFLAEGGIIILDNSDGLAGTCELLRDRGLFQVDFSGFVPMLDHCNTTSIFIECKSKRLQAGFRVTKPIGAPAGSG